MKAEDLFRRLRMSRIPLADIRVVFNGYLDFPFDSISIHGDDEIDDEKAEHAIKRLEEGYPANYLAGYIDILGLHLHLNEDTLIPRNETADFIYTNIKDNKDFDNKKILDLCTGSGFIALAIKKYHPSSDITGSDISEGALKIAIKNASENNLDVRFIKSDYFKDIDQVFDIVVCNPPYIEEDSKDVDAPFEPKIALYSGKDGLDSYRAIFIELHNHLIKGGIAYFELESTNSKNTENLFLSMHKKGYKTTILKDSYGRDRYLKIESL